MSSLFYKNGYILAISAIDDGFCKVRMLGNGIRTLKFVWNLVNSMQSLAPSGNCQVDDGAGLETVPGGFLS